jgi:hypothetical protein
MSLKIEVSVGELLDKITILQIKSERIADEAKLANIRRELGVLSDAWEASPLSRTDVSGEMAALKRVNEALWDIEDDIRRKEAQRQFDGAFIDLARSVYKQNDRRAAIKKELNLKLGSALVEEKSYEEYDAPE